MPSDSPILSDLLAEEMVTDVEQLQHTLSMLRSQRSVLQQEIERLEVIIIIIIIIMPGQCCQDLHWLPINQCVIYKLSVLTYKALHTAQPCYLSDFIELYRPSRVLRSSNSHLLAVPSCSKCAFASQAFVPIATQRNT